MLFFFGIVLYGIIINLREISLDQALLEKNLTTIDDPSIVVDRRNYTLSLYSDTMLVKQYNAVFGRNNSRLKLSSDDFVTPIGKYRICRIDTNYIYYKKMFINYPNPADAAEALRMNHISKSQFLKITRNLNNDCPFADTPLGNDIGIQGIGEYNVVFKNLPFVFNWTNGSIAVSNEDIDELLSIVGLGTNVIIKN